MEVHMKTEKKRVQGYSWTISLDENKNDIDLIKKKLFDSNASQVYSILHDRDLKREKDGSIIMIDGVPIPRENHYHFAFRFDTSYNLDTVANILGVPENYIERVRDWRGICNYLIHNTSESKRQGKYQYNIDNIECIKGNIKNYIQSCLVKTVDDELSEVLRGIENMSIAPYNITQYCSQNTYVKYKRQIMTAFEYQDKKNAEVNRLMNVIFIEGKSASGKTSLAKQLCEEMGFKPYITSQGKNPFDDYGGESAIILDDCRPSDFKFNDFLKLLDNNTASLVGCRYYNKSLYRCKVMIITSTLSLEKWYQGMQESDNEAIMQLTRRVSKNLVCNHIDGNGLIFAEDRKTKDIYLVQMTSWVKQESEIDNIFARFKPSKPTLLDCSLQEESPF